MLRYYFISSWRNLKKNRLVSTINILGLAIGLITAVLAVIYARHELSFEQNHFRSDDIHMVFTYGDLGSIKKIPQSFSPVGPYLGQNFPEIEKIARTRNISGVVFLDSIPVEEKDIIVAESSLYSILTINFLQGRAPSGPQSMALSEKMSRRYFDKEDPVGKYLTINIFGQKMDMKVTGVFEDMPSNTHFKSSCIIPFTMADHLQWPVDKYQSADYKIYSLLNAQTDVKALNQKILEQFELPVQIENVKVGLVPIKRIHLHETIEENNQANLVMLLVGGIVALLISCFNYININSILFSTRMKEVGIKKSFGAGKLAVFSQFMVDTLLSAFIGLVMALLILYMILPSFNSLLSSDIQLSLDLETTLIIVGVLLATVILAGFYPAFGSSHFKPLVLMSSGSGHHRMGKKRLTNTLITLQFLVAVILLQFIVIIFKQGEYMFKEEVSGYNADNVICLDGHSWGDLKTVKAELMNHPEVELVSWGSGLPGADMSMTNTWKEEENKEMALTISAEQDYLDIFKINMLDGRFFQSQYQSDKFEKVVINELTAFSLGYDQPIGKTMKLYGKDYQIVGLVDNYQAVPPVFQDMPLIITRAKDQEKNLLIRVDPKKRAVAHARIGEVLRMVNPDNPLAIRYYEDIVIEQGKSYVATFTIFEIFVVIIIFNSMMGLFGLSFFVAERKNKEVGVRKVCGASIQHLFWNISKGFLAKLLLAIIIAAPIIYLLGQQYLATFPRHINIGPDIYLIGGFLSLMMLLLASGWKLYEVVSANPANILRYE